MLRGGPNIAVKVPPRQWEQTVRFCAESMGLTRIDSFAPSVVFDLGADRVRIDPVETLREAEVWLEFQTDSDATTVALLSHEGFVHGDSIEPLPKGFHRFWIAGPADFLQRMAGDPAR